ncbi:MAG: DUF2087 domain-containing protein [Propionibacteriaceae bacterium]|nr:DUF2087 domain-containing protein [Propionibacteriaceae bacterium]
MPDSDDSRQSAGEQDVSMIPATIARFFDDEGRLKSMPAKLAVRAQVLTWIAHQVLAATDSLNEVELNLALRQFHEDAAMLRRYMVDHGLVTRDPSGRDYRLAETVDDQGDGAGLRRREDDSR